MFMILDFEQDLAHNLRLAILSYGTFCDRFSMQIQECRVQIIEEY